MNDKQFDELKAAVKMMARHMRGDKVPGLRIYEFPDPDVRAIREGAAVSQAEFARLMASMCARCRTGSRGAAGRPARRGRC